MNAKSNSENPYLSGRHEWNERYGSYIAAARRWRWVAVLSLLLASVAVAGVIWLTGQPRLIPYVVEVDGKGEPTGVYAAQHMKDPKVELNVLRFQIARFVQGVRGVSPDVNIQSDLIKSVYALLSQGYPAYQTVNEWFRHNSPLQRAATETVAVKVEQILSVSEKSWRVEWKEHRRNREGVLLSNTAMTGTLTVLSGGEVSEKNLLLNPTGLYVTHFEWQKQLGE